MIALEACRGCRDDFYNDKNPYGVKRCWSAETGTMKRRWETGTWTRPTVPGAFTEVEVPSCYGAEGRHFRDDLPLHAVSPVRLPMAAEGGDS